MMKITVILFTILSLVNANEFISYNIKNINCEVIPHEYDEFYNSACKIWKREMSKNNPENMIQCTTSVDGDTGKIMHGCKPSFGEDNDIIKVSYHFKNIQECSAINNTCSSPKYSITAKTTLHNALHPTTRIIVMIFSIMFFILICACGSHDHNDAFIGAYMGATLFGGGGNNYGNGNNMTWTYDN